MGWKGRLFDRLVASQLTHRQRAAIALLRYPKSALNRWSRSYVEQMAVDEDGSPLPWFTYSFIHFVTPRIPPSATVFEYGLGNSTRWWAARTASVDACEHDPAWMQKVAPALPSNVSVHFHPKADEAYINACADTGRRFDILVIDGQRRVECAIASRHNLNANGVVIWDNSDWDHRFADGFVALTEFGLTGRIDFWGMAPINPYVSATAVFYRPGNNILGI